MIFWYVFIILTIMHPISDFIVRNITWGKWYCDLLHYGLSLNPFHYLVDITIGKVHARYYTVFDEVITYEIRFANPLYNSNMAFKKFLRPYRMELVEKPFWFFLGIDQLMHVFMNIFLAAIMELIL